MRPHLGAALTGLALGVTLTLAGFADYGEVHRMFALTDLRLIFTFAGAVAISFVGLGVLARGAAIPRRSVRRSTVIGAALFGVGWALTGACPGAALAQLGNGYVPALASLGGIFAGALIHDRLRARLGWESDACGS
ncbi:MAG TPA: DUF6691 family protein [Polyangia bacterium]|nr:DUF6691 family protein [Polyangia bacterium]